MFPLRDAENKKKMGSLNDETRSTREWWAATRSQGVAVSDWPRRLFRLHVIHFLNFLCHLHSLSLFRAFHSKIASQKSSFAESVRFYLRLADDIFQAARTTSQFQPTGRRHSVLRSPLCRTTTVEPYKPPEDGEFEVDFFSLRATFRAINGLQQPRKYRLPMGCTHIHKLWKFSRSDFDWIISDLQSAETTSSHPNQRKRCNLVWFSQSKRLSENDRSSRPNTKDGWINVFPYFILFFLFLRCKPSWDLDGTCRGSLPAANVYLSVCNWHTKGFYCNYGLLFSTNRRCISSHLKANQKDLSFASVNLFRCLSIRPPNRSIQSIHVYKYCTGSHIIPLDTLNSDLEGLARYKIEFGFSHGRNAELQMFHLPQHVFWRLLCRLQAKIIGKWILIIELVLIAIKHSTIIAEERKIKNIIPSNLQITEKYKEKF
jgi:hypothetical protein